MRFTIQTPQQLAAHLRALRKVKGLSQAELGGLLGVGQSRIAKIERDPTAVSVDQLLKVLSILGVRMVLEPRADLTAPGDKRDDADW
jgi:HTH-type transcriptional regulator/antitoxin HipB